MYVNFLIWNKFPRYTRASQKGSSTVHVIQSPLKTKRRLHIIMPTGFTRNESTFGRGTAVLGMRTMHLPLQAHLYDFNCLVPPAPQRRLLFGWENS